MAAGEYLSTSRWAAPKKHRPDSRKVTFAVMPTVGRLGPYRMFFFSNEGTEPPHVHVQRERCLAKFWLHPIALAGVTGFRAVELRKIERIVALHQYVLLEAWREHFGK